MLLYLMGIICIFISIFYLVYLAAGLTGRKRWKIVSRLQYVRSFEGELDELEPLNLPFKDRIIHPVFKKIGKLLESFTPEEMRRNLSSKITAAGYMHKSAMSNYLAIQAALTIGLSLLFILLSMISSINFGRIILLGLTGFLLSFVLPNLVLNSRKSARQKQIKKDLPDMLDLLVISVEAGLGLDMALVKVTEKMKGTLSDELNNALSEIKMGKVRRLALREMAERTGVDELISFIGAIFQADQLGVPIGNVLRVQAESMRTYRRQKIEEQAAKAPVKMLFPLVLCILPSLFVILLGPALIRIMKVFAGMK